MTKAEIAKMNTHEKFIHAKELYESGEAATILEAVTQVGISEATYHNYNRMFVPAAPPATWEVERKKLKREVEEAESDNERLRKDMLRLEEEKAKLTTLVYRLKDRLIEEVLKIDLTV